MSSKKSLALLFIATAGICLPASAQEDSKESSKENTISVQAQIRTRAEYRNGAIDPRDEGEAAAGFVNERARLSLGYERKGLSMKFSAQHVGVWGQDALVDKNGRFILNEAWAKINIVDGLFVQAGRQNLSYDDERILGGLDWNVAGRYHDALKVGYQKNGHTLHGIFAFNQNDETTGGGSYYDNSTTKLYKNMQTLWYHYQAKDTPFGISVLAMNLGKEAGESGAAKTKYMQTFGTYITYKPDAAWDLSGAFYYQTGKTTASRTVSAYMGSLKIGYAINSKWSVNVGEDYLSGSKDSDGKYKAFDPLYGTHHKFYGAMDYFYASTFANGAPGLSDTQVGVAYKVTNPLKLALNYHYFATGVKLEGLNRTLGSEIDFQLDWKIQKDISISAGYSTMFGSSTMDYVKGGNHKSYQDWGWISLNVNPQMFFKF